jgi:hypothetical protein
MKKIILTIAGWLAVMPAAFSQTDNDKHTGFQFSLIYPLSTNGIRAPKYSNWVSLNLLGGISRNERMLTIGGLTNIITRDAQGFQLAGLYNGVGHKGQGFMLGGLANSIGSHYDGFQLAGLTNIAGGMDGLQFAGLMNIAGDISGLQFAGLVNIAKKVKGVQFAGLVNIAKESDYPIGLVNIIRNGRKSISVSYNEIGSLIVSFRSGGRVTYGIIGYGFCPAGVMGAFTVEGGFGAHLSLSRRFRIDNELKIETLIGIGSANTFKAGYTLLPVFSLTRWFGVFVGPSINYMQTDDSYAAPLPRQALWQRRGQSKIQQLHVGYLAGVQFAF